MPLAVEDWPLATDEAGADGSLGREQVFERLGFTNASRPSPRRAVRRLEL